MLGSDHKRLYERYKFLKGSIVVIEGNIASGKSTLTERMTEFLNAIGLKADLYKEPILESYLNLFLKDMKQYAFGFQMSMLLENQCLYKDALNFIASGGIAVMDRSFMGNKVFADSHYEKGNITQEQMAVYEDVYSRMDFPLPSYIIYLSVDPIINIQRCEKRSRTCEKDAYDLQYFADLNRIYNKLIQNLSDTNNILLFDWNKDIPDRDYSQVLTSILDNMRTNYLAL